MVSGLASGVFWGAMASVVVLAGASLMAPLPEVATGPAATGQVPAPLAAPQTDAAPVQPEGLVSGTDQTPVTPEPEEIATAIDLPAGSEFTKPKEDADPALPVADAGPATAAPSAPAAPEAVAGGPAVETAPLTAPSVAPEAPGSLPGAQTAPGSQSASTVPIAPTTADSTPDPLRATGPSAPASETAPAPETTTDTALPRQTPESPGAETSLVATGGEVATPLATEGTAPLVAPESSAPLTTTEVAPLPTTPPETVPQTSDASPAAPAEGQDPLPAEAEAASATQPEPVAPAQAGATDVVSQETGTTASAPATSDAPLATPPVTAAEEVAPSGTSPETVAEAEAEVGPQTQASVAPGTTEEALPETTAETTEVATQEAATTEQAQQVPQTAQETALETAPEAAPEAAAPEIASVTVPEATSLSPGQAALSEAPVVIGSDVPVETPKTQAAETASQLALAPELPGVPQASDLAQTDEGSARPAVSDDAAAQVATAGLAQQAEPAPAATSDEASVPLVAEQVASADPSQASEAALTGTQDAVEAPAEDATFEIATAAPEAPQTPELNAPQLAGLAEAPAPAAPAPQAEAAAQAPSNPEVTRGTEVTPTQEGTSARPPAPKVIDRAPGTSQGFGVRVKPLTERQVPGVKTSRLPRIGDPAPEPTPAATEATEATEAEAAEAAAEDQAKLSALARNAAPFENPDEKPLFSVVLIDVGAKGLDRATLQTFSFPVTFAIDPSEPTAAEAAATYRAAGFEVMILPTGLPSGAQPQDVEVTMSTHLTTVPQAVGILDLAEGGLGSNQQLAAQLLAVAKDDGHGIVFYDRGLNSAKRAADRAEQPAGLVFRQLDAGNERSTVIRRYLDRAAFKAGQEGQVIMVGHTYAETVTALFEWALEGKAEQVSLAPVSTVLRAQ